MECRNVRELANSFLAQELLVETNHELVRHLETCPACRADLASRKAVLERLRRAFAGAEELRPRLDFAAEMAARLRPRETLSRRSLLKSWSALAAGIFLAVGGGALIRDGRWRAHIASVARQAAGDHQNCAIRFNLAERPIELAEAARRYGDPYPALATFELPANGGTPLTVLERHSCVYAGRRFGHVVLRSEGAVASLLVTDGPAPSSVILEPTNGAPAVASFPAGRFLAFIVADLDPSKVLRLAERIATPLSRHLSA
jgi:hypothetical protein